MRVIRAADYRRMPWKNGGGETIEIAVSPPGASLDSFDWRVSMAHVERPGPFSTFPGIDRSLAVLDGEGLVLRLDSQQEVRLEPSSAPFPFAADIPVEADLIGGSVTDLNIMTRRGRVKHRLRRIEADRPVSLSCASGLLLVLVQGASAAIRGDGNPLALAAGDTVLAERQDGALTITTEGTATLFSIELWFV